MRLISCAVVLFVFAIRGWTVNAQIDSVGVFKTVRNFSDANKKELTILFTTSAIAASGCVHANFYQLDSFGDVHSCVDVQTYSILMLGYVAGLDPVESVGLGLVANFLFVGFINKAIFGRWVNPNEDCAYDSFGWNRRKLFCGNQRYAMLGTGLVLLNYKQILKWLK